MDELEELEVQVDVGTFDREHLKAIDRIITDIITQRNKTRGPEMIDRRSHVPGQEYLKTMTRQHEPRLSDGDRCDG